MYWVKIWKPPKYFHKNYTQEQNAIIHVWNARCTCSSRWFQIEETSENYILCTIYYPSLHMRTKLSSYTIHFIKQFVILYSNLTMHVSYGIEQYVVVGSETGIGVGWISCVVQSLWIYIWNLFCHLSSYGFFIIYCLDYYKRNVSMDLKWVR